MGQGQYKDFQATYLYCDRCGRSMPVVERLVLILPDGELYDYVCRQCGQVTGDKKVSSEKPDAGFYI